MKFLELYGGSLKIPVSTLEEPVWFHDGSELSLAVQKEDEFIVWVSIEERNDYCDRGHYLVKLHQGIETTFEDFRPNYYMRLEVAKNETVDWLRWRLGKQRCEPFGAIRYSEKDNLELLDEQA